MADQIAAAKRLGFPNLGAAIEKFGFNGWQKAMGMEAAERSAAPSPTAAVGPIGKPTPFTTPEVPEAQMHSPWGRPILESPESMESQEQRVATHANMDQTPKSISMMQFKGVEPPATPSSPHVKSFNPETYTRETDPTLQDLRERAAKSPRAPTKKDNFENRLADSQKRKWTD